MLSRLLAMRLTTDRLQHRRDGSPEKDDMDRQSVETWAPRVLRILRVVTAVLFFEHGFKSYSIYRPGHRPLLRPSCIRCLEPLAVAYRTAHAPKSLIPVLNGGDAAILYCFIFLYLVVAGPGPWSIDELRKN